MRLVEKLIPRSYPTNSPPLTSRRRPRERAPPGGRQRVGSGPPGGCQQARKNTFRQGGTQRSKNTRMCVTVARKRAAHRQSPGLPRTPPQTILRQSPDNPWTIPGQFRTISGRSPDSPWAIPGRPIAPGGIIGGPVGGRPRCSLGSPLEPFGALTALCKHATIKHVKSSR